MVAMLHVRHLQQLKNCYLPVVSEIALKNTVSVWEEKAGDSKRNVWACNISSLWSIA